MIVTVVTVSILVQTAILIYFMGKYAYKEPEVIDPITRAYVDELIKNTVTHSQVEMALSGLESDILDTVETLSARIDNTREYLEGLKSLSDGLLDVIEGLGTEADQMELRMDNMDKKIEEVSSEIKSSNINRSVEEWRTKNMAPEAAVAAAPEAAVAAAPEIQEPKLDEVKLVEPRGEDAPLITDLRAEPFEEYRDGVNIHQLPPIGSGYEVMDSRGTRGRSMPRQRAFRNL